MAPQEVLASYFWEKIEACVTMAACSSPSPIQDQLRRHLEAGSTSRGQKTQMAHTDEGAMRGLLSRVHYLQEQIVLYRSKN